MLFKYKPHAALSLGQLVRFNSIGEFTTNDSALIEKLSKLPMVVKVGEQTQPTETEKIEEEIKETQPTQEEAPITSVMEEASVDGVNIGVLREQYREKFNQKCYHGWTAEQIKAKLAE